MKEGVPCSVSTTVRPFPFTESDRQLLLMAVITGDTCLCVVVLLGCVTFKKGKYEVKSSPGLGNARQRTTYTCHRCHLDIAQQLYSEIFSPKCQTERLVRITHCRQIVSHKTVTWTRQIIACHCFACPHMA